MAAATSSLYNDFSGLAELRYQARQDQAGSAEKVARQFESLFVQMMVKQMRQAGFGGGVFDSDRTRFYQEMYDQQLSLQLGEQGGLGLRQILRRQLGGGPEERAALSGLDDYWRHPVVRSSAARPNPAAGPQDPVEAAPATATQACSPALDSPHSFVQNLWSCARQAAEELGLPPEALLAQAALETGWGSAVMKSGDGGSSHNLFGIKADQRWQGEAVRRQTLEYDGAVAVRKREAFRAYGSFAESFQDYVALLKGSPRYAQALQKAGDPAAYFRSLQDAGYATDPAYADKILRVMRGPEMQAALASFKASS